MSIFVSPSKNIPVKKHSQLITNPILVDASKGSPNPLYFVAETIYSKNEITNFRSSVEGNFPNQPYKLLSSIAIAPTSKVVEGRKVSENERETAKFYRQNRLNLEKYIPANSKVISIGNAILSICQSDDLVSKTSFSVDEKDSIIQGFYDPLLNHTYFNSPDLMSRVWVVDPLSLWASKSNYENYFFKTQMERALKSDYQFRRIKPIEKVYVEDPNKFLKEHMLYDGIMSWDIETVGLDPWAEEGRIICLTISFDGRTGFFLDWDKINLDLLPSFFNNKKGIGTNLKYDKKWLVVHGGVPRGNIKIVSDTMHLSHTINQKRRHGLKSSVWFSTESLGGYDRELDLYKEDHPECKTDYSKIPKDLLFPYATIDPCASYQCNEYMLKELKDLSDMCNIDRCQTYMKGKPLGSLEKYYNTVIVPGISVFTNVELNGMPINKVALEAEGKVLRESIAKAKQELYEALKPTLEDGYIEAEENSTKKVPSKFLDLDDEEEDTSINSGFFNSNTKLSKLLEKRGWPSQGLDKHNKHYLVNDFTLNKWKNLGFKEAELILKLHEYNTLYKTFIGSKEENNGLWKHIKSDGKVHANFGLAMTDSERNNCKNPNLQNQSKHNKGAKNIRSFFMPPSEDHLICELDGASFQLRIEAALSGDKAMAEAFNSIYKDLHAKTGNLIFRPDLPIEEFMERLNSGDKKFKEMRQNSKAPNFSLIFNTTAFSFAKQSLMQGPYAWTYQQAKDYVKTNHLEKRLQDHMGYQMNNEIGNPEDDEEFAYFLTSAENIREKFFKQYSGVKAYIDSIIRYATNYGYVQSPFGAIRRLPYLTSIGEHSSKKKIKNLENIATNSPVQAFEIVLILLTMIELDKVIETEGLKSELVGQVHDSIVAFFHKDEKDRLIKLAKEVFEFNYPENNSIPQELEAEIGDYLKGQYWGFGESYSPPA